ncbi:hypothetical protein ERD78_09440 [Allopusillimonas soli]|nr:hypothetical protein [Allopusillimonas soli]TEA75658.1 hypothetical protein ERD78_09440 [Allopusillimonas soli]
MSIQTLSRWGAVLFAAAFVSGCSLIGLGDSDGDDGRANACKRDRSSCMYEGRYEPGERGYAEEEAKRLNKAASARLRRSADW